MVALKTFVSYFRFSFFLGKKIEKPLGLWFVQVRVMTPALWIVRLKVFVASF